jgi:CheY-like chemotaxis protein
MQRLARRRPVVLVVEDDALVRFTAVSSIEDAGFDVVEAADAKEAISILEVRSDIWAVFTDVQMPGSIDGLQLAHLISVRWPPIKIIAASGRLKLRDDDLPAGGRHLHKPYDSGELIGILKAWTVE